MTAFQPRRFRPQHRGYRFANALQQFDESQAQLAQQRAPGEPRPLSQISQGPTPVTYNLMPGFGLGADWRQPIQLGIGEPGAAGELLCGARALHAGQSSTSGGFNAPSSQVDFKNTQLFGEITGGQTTASFGGQPLMNLMLRLSW